MLISGGGSFWVLENEAYCWVHATARMSQKLHPATIRGHWVRQQEKPFNRSRSQCVVKSQTAINTPHSSTCNVYVTLLKLFAKTIKQNDLFQLIKVLCWLKVLEIEPNCCGNEGKVRIDTKVLLCRLHQSNASSVFAVLRESWLTGNDIRLAMLHCFGWLFTHYSRTIL